MKRIENVAAMCLALWLSASGMAAETAAVGLADCAGIVDIKSKSRQLFDGATLIVALAALEAQGEAQFKPKYAEPASQCAYEKFEVAGKPVTAIYSPFEKGEQTLHYKFVSASESDSREVLVLYDAMASLMAKKSPIFFVAENRGGHISYYVMFRDQPSYAALKPIVVAVLDGSAAPLATVRWPDGAKEPVIDVFDSKRLK
ncbi:MAG TPA: hypothetical protein VK624_07865 [Steroidobacteraceae bacterium]|nr:hypothetical protein [Steroidobacteraceae bacterium]